MGGTTVVHAAWKDGHVEIRSEPEHGPKLVQTYAISADATQLTVTTQIEGRRPVTIRSVYDAVRAPSRDDASDDPSDVEVTPAGAGAR
jgi:hypothetical protein